MDILQSALTLRSSEVTERNPISSRSHAVCSIRFLSNSTQAEVQLQSEPQPQTPSPINTNENNIQSFCGELKLVDLAGSERNYETTKMTHLQHKESAQINLALMSLKDCFQSFHKCLVASNSKKFPLRSNSTSDIDIDNNKNLYSNNNNNINISNSNSLKINNKNQSDNNISNNISLKTHRIPYRASLLTRVLKSCFTSGWNHRTVIIVTISPSPIDLQHTLNSLDHVVLMSPPLQMFTDNVTVEVPLPGSALSHKPVQCWTNSQLQAWLGTANNGSFAHLTLPPGMDGQQLMALNEGSLAELFAGQLRVARQEGEGAAWVIAEDETRRHANIARALWSALRREQQAASIALSKTMIL